MFGKIDPEQECTDPQPVERLSLATGESEVVCDVTEIVENYVAYAACAFREKMYLFGGNDEDEAINDRCLEFDPETDEWEEKERMEEMRESPAACPFEERIVVSGGERGFFFTLNFFFLT